jgi:hypothetical protein
MRVFIVVITTTEKRSLRSLAHWAVNNDGPMPFFPPRRCVLSTRAAAPRHVRVAAAVKD